MKHSTVGPTGEPASTAVPISSAEQVSWQAQQIELAIARRAYFSRHAEKSTGTIGRTGFRPRRSIPIRFCVLWT